MAKIVLGLGTSHGPQLMVPPESWELREPADRKNPHQWYKGKSYSFDELFALRKGEKDFAREMTIENKRARFAKCQEATKVLRQVYGEVKPDVAVIIGNDQFEVFSEVNIPAFSVFWGETFQNIPKTPEQMAKLPQGAAPAEKGYCPPEITTYSGQPALGKHIIESLGADSFDIAQSTRLPVGPTGANSIPHAYGYVYRQIMQDDVIPNVPVMVNTHYPPNRPSAGRCFEFGRALARAIQSWDADRTVALIASGGMTHYVINEEFDHKVFGAVRRGDWETIKTLPENMFEAGTAEHKNWIPVYGAMAEAGLTMTLVDYVPCYRSVAGTGNAMGFAYWRR